MASYRPITLPDVAALRSYVLSALARFCAVVCSCHDCFSFTVCKNSL